MNAPAVASVATVDAVLFDIGGVVVEVNDMVAYLKDHGVGDTADFHARWLHCPAVRLYEGGGCDQQAFANGVVRDLGLDMPPGVFLDYFERWPRGLFPGVKDLIRETRRHVTVGCLSNTNDLHWPRFADELEADTLFDHRILSFEIGLLKPDAEIYEYAAERLELAPRAILFLDDNPLNVDAARRAGFRAEHVVGPEQARAAIAGHGVAVRAAA